MPRPGFLRRDLIMHYDGKIPSLKNRLASFVMIEVKTPLYSFRRVVKIRPLSDVFAQKNSPEL